MKYIITATIVGCILFLTKTQAVDLNASGEKTVTFGSEIKRGSDAGTKIQSGYLVTLVNAYFKLLDENKQANKDSEGFMIGWRYDFWLKLDIALHLDGIESINDKGALKLGSEAAATMFIELRKQQKRLSLSDEDLWTATGGKSELVAQRFEEYKKLYDPK